MPLRYTEDPADLNAVKNAPEQYIVFYSSRDKDGKMWCPDCRDVEQLVKDKFSSNADGAPSALVVFVGQRPAWKSRANPFRGDPWNVGSVPTVIRQKDGARLGDDSVLRELAAF